jgi:hypothetical protein
MDEKTRATLKSFFETGDRPTEEQFAQLIDSMINKKDDGIFIILPARNVGIGVASPKEKLDIAGGIRLGQTGNALPGIIRWTGSDFEGFDGQAWRSLTHDPDASKALFIPQPRIECSADNLFAWWEEGPDNRFLSHEPVFWLYRYKSRIKQTFADKTKKSRIKPKHWAHTGHRDMSHNNPRNTEFQVAGVAGKKQLLNIEPLKWFRPLPGNGVAGYFIPKGQGISPVPKKAYFNRRFEYFRLRIVVRVQGQLVFGPFSEVFSMGYRRRYYRDPVVKKYKPVFELITPGKGMMHK